MDRRIVLTLIALEAAAALDDAELVLGSTLRPDPDLVAAVATWAEGRGYRTRMSRPDSCEGRVEVLCVFRGDFETIVTVHQLVAKSEAA